MALPKPLTGTGRKAGCDLSASSYAKTAGCLLRHMAYTGAHPDTEFDEAIMTQDNETIFRELCKLLEPFNAAGVTLSRRTDISADLNIDSVSVMDFIMEIEDKYDIDIPLNLLSDIRTLDELTGVVEARLDGAIVS